MMKFGHQSIINGFGLIMLISCLQLTAIALRSEPPKALLTSQEIRDDLQFLQQQLVEHSSFAAIAPQRLALISERAQRLAELSALPVKRTDFAMQLHKVLAPLDDIASDISDVDSAVKLPIHLQYNENGWQVLNNDSTPIDSEHPFITHIDGVPIARWIDAWQLFLAPSQQSQPDQQAKLLHHISLLRKEIGIMPSDHVRITLRDLQQHIRQLNVSLQYAAQTALAPLPKSESYFDAVRGQFSLHDLSKLPQNSQLQKALSQSLLTPLTIIDLRNAYGHGDQLLTWLAQHYRDQSLAPSVNATSALYAIARYRRAPNQRSDYLSPLQFIAYDNLSHDEQLQLTRASQQIHTQFDARFSQWHARKWPHSEAKLAIGRAMFSPATLTKPSVTESTLSPYQTYSQPMPQYKPAWPTGLTSATGQLGQLVLLIGPDCRQQCQWIAHFAQQWSSTLLIGKPTRGSFDRYYLITLPNSNIKVSISSSVIYDMFGQRLSGLATYPDILTNIDDFLWRNSIISLIHLHASKDSSE